MISRVTLWKGEGMTEPLACIGPALHRPHRVAAACRLSLVFLVLALTVTAPASAAGGPAALGELSYQKLLPHQLTDRATLLVNAANGNVVLQTEDLNIAGTKLPLSITRYFNDQANTAGLPGYGTTLSVGPDINIQSNADGSATYQGPSGFKVVYPSDGHGGYTIPAAYTGATLTKESDGWKLAFHESGEVYTFDSSGRETRDATASGQAITYAYGADGRLETATDTQGRVTHFEYKSNQQGYAITDPSGRVVRYWEDAKGRLTDVYGAGPTEFWEYTYGPAGDLTGIEDPMGNKIKLTYNAAHQVTAIDYPKSIKYTYTYNVGNTVVTDPLKHTTTYDYDGTGRVTNIIDGDGNSHGTSWNENNDVTGVTDPAGATTKLSYDAATNNLTTVQNPNLPNGTTGAVTSFSYGDAAHPFSPTGATDAQGNQTTFSYDTSGNLKAAGGSASAGGPTGVVASLIQGDPNGEGGTVNCGAQTGEVCSTIDANGHSTTYGYDSAGNLTHYTPPEGVGSEIIGYDGLSRPISITDANGNTESITYDTDDRPTEVKTVDADVSYTYDYDGNLKYITNNGSTTEYYYDTNNRLYEMQQSGTWIAYVYDKANNLKSETEPHGKTTYAYDRANYVTKIANSASHTTVALEYTNGRPTTVKLPGAIVETIGYDQSGRETSIKATKGSAVLTNYTGTYESAGKDTELLQSETNGLTGLRSAFSYDGLDRLTSAIQSGPAPLNSFEYAYDLNGNLLRTTHNGTPGPLLGYSAANELTSVNGQPTGGYDMAGDQTLTPSGLAIGYNSDDQAISFTPPQSPAIPAGYASSVQDLRTRFGASTQVNGLLGLYTDQQGEQSTYYTHLPTGTSQTIGETIGNSSYFYLPDLAGSTAAVTDAGGSVKDAYTYDPYGNKTQETGSVPNPWRFDDGYLDSQTGLYKLGQRYYDPGYARWTQLDPSGRNTGYAFAADDPVNVADPTGTFGGLKALLAEVRGCVYGGFGAEIIAGAVIAAGTDGAALPLEGIILGGCASGAAEGGLNSYFPHSGDPLKAYDIYRILEESGGGY
jgi:RHS repeat-associated protein